MESLELSKKVRLNCLNMAYNAQASHIGSALSIVDILSVLYENVLVYSRTNPDWGNRDRLILSKGHACIALYSVLAEKAFFPKELLQTYGKSNSALMHHISHKVPGVEFSTGSLGHGFPFAVGKSLSAKINKQDWRTFVILSDGELQEGSNWEAFMFAGFHKLYNVIPIIDYNNLQSLATVDATLSIEPLRGKLENFGWNVIEIDGHNHKLLENSLNSLPKGERPTVIIAKTVKGKGVSFMEDKVIWHYKSPNVEEYKRAIEEVKNA